MNRISTFRHAIHLIPLKNDRGVPTGEYLLRYNEKDIGKTSQNEEPLFVAARYLLGEGLADHDDSIATFRGLTLCLSGRVGDVALLRVEENSEVGPRFRPLNPEPRDYG